MIYINNNKIKGFGGIKRAYLNNTLIFQSFKKDEEVISPYDITSTFNVTSTTSPTKVCNKTSAITEMYVDGVQIDIASGYTFNTNGEHTVQYMLKDKTKIGDEAFRDCQNLLSVTIGSGVKTIGPSSFYYCLKLSSVEIQYGVENIERFAFGACYGLKSIEIPSSVTTIGQDSFYNCQNLTSITIPSSVTSIHISAFEGCYFHKDNFINNSSANYYPWSAIIYDTIQDDGLYILGTTVVKCKQDATNVTIPDSITSISNGAFYNCTSLSNITIPSNVISIGNEAFLDCSSLNEITCLGTTAPTLGSNVFMGLPKNGNFTYPCESDYSAWLEQLGWKDTCNQGGQERWVALTQNTDRSIQMQTFRIDTTYPEFEDGNRFITFSTEQNYPGENADLTDFSICINEDTIYDNYSRKYIRDQKHIEGNVYEYTFSVPVYFAGGERNAPLSQVQYKTTSGETPEEPGEEGIPDFNVTNYDVKASFDVTSTTSQTKLCYSSMTTAFTEMYIDGEQYGVTSGYTFNTTGKHTVHYVLKNNTILTSFGTNGIFKDCSDLEEMVIKDSVKTINDNVFTNCSKLKKITIGSGLTKLGSGNSLFAKPVFSGCTSLTSITCNATTAPTLTTKSFNGIERNSGVLYVPQGSDYSTWTSILTTWNVEYLT